MTEQIQKPVRKDKTVFKMIALAAVFFVGVTVMTLLPEAHRGLVSPFVILGIVLVLFKL